MKFLSLPNRSPVGKRPWLLEFRSSTWFITTTVATAIFTDIFLYAVIVPVFPFSLHDRLKVAESDVQHWLSILLSVYGAALVVAAPFFGWLSDRIDNRREVLLGGMVVLAASTVMLCLAPSLAILTVGRFLQGAAAGCVWVVGLALLAESVGKEKAGQAMGYVALAYSIAALVAPLLGGVVYNQAGYYAVFAMAFGMIGLDIVMRLLLIEKKVAKYWLPDEASVPTPLSAEKIPTSQAEIEPESQQPDISIAKKLPPILILLKSRRMQATFFSSLVAAMILTAFDVTLPLFVEDTFHWSSLGAGLIFLPLLCPAFIQPIYGRLVDKHGPRWIAVAGLLICIPPFVCLRFVTQNSIQHKVLLCALLFIIGLGASLILAAAMTEFTMICTEKERKQPGSMGRGGAFAQSYALFNVSWALGSLIASYWAAGVKEAAGWGTMSWSFALLCGVITIPTCLYVGGGLLEQRRKKDQSSREST